MTQPSGDGAQSGTEPGTQSGAGENAGANDGTANATGAQSGTEAAPAGRTYSEAEVAAIQNRMRAADQRAAALEAERNQLRDKDLPALEKATRDLAEAAAAREKAETELKNSRIHNAFLRDNTHEWHNPDRALTMLDLSKVDIDDQGNVTGLKAAIEALAKSDAYLLKPKPDNGGDGGTGTGNGSSPQLQGTVPGTNGTAGGGKANKADLQRRFPAMRSRTQ